MVHCPAMNSLEALLWLIAATVALAVGGALANAWLRERKRRARYLSYVRASQEGQRSASAPGPLTGGMTPEMARAIRAHAERSARRQYEAGAAAIPPTNPYDAGTPEQVLWIATYHLVMHDLTDPPAEPAAAPAPGRGGRP